MRNHLRALIIVSALLALIVAASCTVESPKVKRDRSVMRDCSTCHVTHKGSMLLKAPLSGLCIECHPERVRADHKVDVVPSMDVGGLPLDKDGKMTCATCHDPHDKSSDGAMLRVEPANLCARCHKE